MLVTHDSLEKTIHELLVQAGSEADEAHIVSSHLVEANLLGHDSHGVGMIPHYMKNLHNKTLFPNTAVKLERNDGNFVIADGGRGYGQRVAREAMAQAIDRCSETGLTVLSLRNAHHIGRIGSYGQQAMDAGLVSMHFVNVVDHDTLVAPWSGAQSRFGTNPVCLAMPGSDDHDPVLLDMATSKVAFGKIRVAYEEGRQLKDGMIVAPDGQATNDPGAMFVEPQAAMMPMGDHKGSGLAMFCELFAGALTGYGTIQPQTERRGGIVNNMLAILVRPEELVDRSWMNNEVNALINYVKSANAADSENPVMVAGDPERKSRATREAQGIPMDANTWNGIVEAGESIGYSADRANAELQVINAN